MTWVSRGLLTLANFFPISLIIGLMCFKSCAPIPGWIFVALSGVGILTSIYVVAQLFATVSGSHQPLTNIEENNEDLIVYITSFMPPFIVDDITNVYIATSLAVFYGLLLLTVVSSKRVFANPLYLVLGVRFYSAEKDAANGGGTILLIARGKKLAGAAKLKLKNLGHDGCYLVTG